MSQSNADLAARARALMPGGVSHELRYRAPYPTYVTRALGGEKSDVEGKRYIDFKLGAASQILGHAHPDIVEAETGQSIGWHEVGGFRIATTEDGADWMRSIMGGGKLLDLPMERVGPDEVARVNPFYKTDDVKAAVRTFEDGHIDPSGVTMALAAATRARGAKIERHSQVLGARRKGDMWLLRTEKRDVLAEHVVIAADRYANQVGDWFGRKIPSVSCLHHSLVTDTVPEFEGRPELPVMRDNAYDGSIRQEQRSGLIGIYEGHVCPTGWEMPQGAPNVWLSCGSSMGLA